MIGRAVLATLLPPRRLRYSARTVKSSRSRYPSRASEDPRPARPAAITAITITISSPSAGKNTRPSPRKRRQPPPGSRHHHIMTIMNTDPGHAWTGHDLAGRLHVPQRNLLTQLAHWTHTGLLKRTSTGTYALNTPPDPESSTAEPDPLTTRRCFAAGAPP